MHGKRPVLFVTNFNRNFTGVSATAAAVLRLQQHELDLRLVGHPLPGCPEPITRREALKLSKQRPDGLPFSIWHVRRNSEMQTAIFARDVLRLPIRIVFTSAAQRRHSAYPRFLISRMDEIIATTDEAASYLHRVAAVAPHGVDTSRFYAADDRTTVWQQTGFPGHAGIATVGRIRPEKGTDRFVDAMIEALPQLPGVTALVIGKARGEHKAFQAMLEDRVKKAGLEERILFTGEINAERMPEIFRAVSLLVALPRYEGYGMTPLESMASATPFIATDTGYFSEFSGNGEAGIVIEQGDTVAHEAAQRVIDVLSDPLRFQAFAKQAERRARSQFSIEREVAKIAEVYKTLWKQE